MDLPVNGLSQFTDVPDTLNPSSPYYQPSDSPSEDGYNETWNYLQFLLNNGYSNSSAYGNQYQASVNYNPYDSNFDIGDMSSYSDDVGSWLEAYQKYWNQNNQYNRELYEDNKAYNSREAQIAREWDLWKENTYYQRMMNSMKEAGINPLLAFQTLGAVSSGGSQSASVNMGGASSNTMNPSSMYSALINKLGDNKSLAGSLISSIVKILGIMALIA